jgi:hypothetical protein
MAIRVCGFVFEDDSHERDNYGTTLVPSEHYFPAIALWVDNSLAKSPTLDLRGSFFSDNFG